MTSVSITASIVVLSSLSYADQNCVTEKCHADTITKKYAHAPAAKNQCDYCHWWKPPHYLIDPKTGKHYPPRGTAPIWNMCKGCHKKWFHPNTKNMVLHGPVKVGDCLACHEPHESDYKYLLNRRSTLSLCLSCHGDKIHFYYAHMHAPYSEKRCLSCHDVHGSNYKYNLISDPKEQCSSCHKNEEPTFTQIREHHEQSTMCTVCHSPHASELKYFLRSKNGSKKPNNGVQQDAAPPRR